LGDLFLLLQNILQKKVTISQQKQTMQLASLHNIPIQQIAPVSLNIWDKMEVLWLGFENYVKAKNGGIWITSIMIGIFGGAMISSPRTGLSNVFIILVIFYLILFIANLLPLVYFVGRKVEKKVEEKVEEEIKKQQKQTQIP
jgi:hypothetical protein